MLNTTQAIRGMAVAPHSLAAQSALAILREGGNAIEATIAAAATIAVVYPHMNSLGGDSFWLISLPDRPVIAIDACGFAGQRVSQDLYRSHGLEHIPVRGPLAANTVAGTVSGWDVAWSLSRKHLDGKVPLSRVLADAIYYAETGIPATISQFESTRKKRDELARQPGFVEAFLVAGQPPPPGSRFVQTALGQTLRVLAKEGLDQFYRGALAESIAHDLASSGSPLTLVDLNDYRARQCRPLLYEHRLGELYNMTPPTQGLVSLIILAILDKLHLEQYHPDSADYVHLVVEATKQAFLVRDRYITDPDYMTIDPQSCLTDEFLSPLAAAISIGQACPRGLGKAEADTVWMGVMDEKGRAVSFIQSIYHEFGSGIVLPATGITWQNRGCSFSLSPGELNCLMPRRKPFHTLNPALARFHDGRTMIYGSMGGDGQPQTQAAVFTRYAIFHQPLQHAITSPRWLFGRTWGQDSDTLKLEGRFPKEVLAELTTRGHEVEVLNPFDETMGHAGAIVRYPTGILEGAFDPRSNGTAAAF
jgi:gamma-glutamyltranspeptidase/glutathione hydrolase